MLYPNQSIHFTIFFINVKRNPRYDYDYGSITCEESKHVPIHIFCNRMRYFQVNRNFANAKVLLPVFVSYMYV